MQQIPGDPVINTSSDSFGLGVGLRFCISNNSPDQLSASGSQIRLGVPRSNRCWLLEGLIDIEAIWLASNNFSFFGAKYQGEVNKSLNSPARYSASMAMDAHGMAVIYQGFVVDELFLKSCLLGLGCLAIGLRRPACDSLRKQTNKQKPTVYLADRLPSEPVDLHLWRTESLSCKILE